MAEPVALQRLGKRDLGPYAFEKQMPPKIAALIVAESEASNSLSGVMENLAMLLDGDGDVDVAYLCTADVRQIYRIEGEGAHFCGYRNIQMLLSALPSTSSGAAASEKLLAGKPTIPDLQRAIEAAWDAGINAHGKKLTGGIEGTRKHVGTSEAEALLLSIDIQCTGHAFHGKQAWVELLDSIEAYFAAANRSMKTTGGKVIRSDRPPIFLQRPNHSISIVGIERTVSGKRRLLAFDPAWRPPAMIAGDLTGTQIPVWRRKYLLSRYRKRQRYLKRYRDFETLSVDG